MHIESVTEDNLHKSEIKHIIPPVVLFPNLRIILIAFLFFTENTYSSITFFITNSKFYLAFPLPSVSFELILIPQINYFIVFEIINSNHLLQIQIYITDLKLIITTKLDHVIPLTPFEEFTLFTRKMGPWPQ
jgi:hypothetical protein